MTKCPEKKFKGGVVIGLVEEPVPTPPTEEEPAPKPKRGKKEKAE